MLRCFVSVEIFFILDQIHQRVKRIIKMCINFISLPSSIKKFRKIGKFAVCSCQYSQMTINFYTWSVWIAALLIMRFAKRFQCKVTQSLTCHHLRASLPYTVKARGTEKVTKRYRKFATEQVPFFTLQMCTFIHTIKVHKWY